MIEGRCYEAETAHRERYDSYSQGYGVRIDSAKGRFIIPQITNCLNHPLYVEGGDVEVNGCTIAQFYPFDGRRESAIGFVPPLPLSR